MLVPPSAGLVEGRDAIRAYWQAGLDTGISAVALETLLLERHEPVAYEIGRYSLWLDGAEGAEASERGAYVLVHELQEDGSWLRAVEMFNPET